MRALAPRPPKSPIAFSLYGRGPERSSKRASRLGFLLVGLLLAAPSAVDAEPRLASGTVELTLGGGPSRSHDVSGTTAGLTGFQLVPHVGLFVGEARGPGWLHGRLELPAEPTVFHLDSRPSATSAGLSAVARWVFAADAPARGYVEAGGGVLTGETGPPEVRCDADFAAEAGGGVLLFWSSTRAVTLGYRFHHLSNGGACAPNHDVNASVLLLGLTTLRP